MAEYKIEDFPKPAILKWAMLVVLMQKDRGMGAGEIDRGVAKILGISDEMYSFRLENGKQYITYRLGWERTRSKKIGYIEKVPGKPGLWQLTEKGRVYAYRKVKLFL